MTDQPTYHLCTPVPQTDIIDAIGEDGTFDFIVALAREHANYAMLLRLRKHFRKAVKEEESDILSDGVGCLACELERCKARDHRSFALPRCGEHQEVPAP